jgi:hypothetical protein
VVTIESLTEEIQGKSPDEVVAVLLARLGPPPRDIPSGARIEKWDVEGGVLTFHSIDGVTFEKAGTRTRLIRTNNPVETCLFGSYEMLAPRPEGPYQMSYWLGNVVLQSDSHYRYKDAGQYRDQRSSQASNFFLRHAEGFVQVEYAPGISPRTRLEDMADGALVARATFKATDGKAIKAYRIVTRNETMRLEFESDEPMTFQLWTGWANKWR